MSMQAYQIVKRGDLVSTGQSVLEVVPEGDSMFAAGLLQAYERISATAPEITAR